jgi:membrane fusion protein (multidrug efflux system)
MSPPAIVTAEPVEPSAATPVLATVPRESAAPPVAPAPAAPPTKKPRAKLVLAALAVVAAAAGTGAWVHGLGTETTDDAFVESHVALVAARTPGQVLRVLVADNQEVAADEVVVELDERDAVVRQAAAKADLESAAANLAAAEAQLALIERTVAASLKQARGGVTQAVSLAGGARAGIDQARADVAAAESRRKLADMELARATSLHRGGAISPAELDARQAAFEQADAQLEQARARLASAQVGIANASGTIETAAGRLLAAQTGPEQVGTARANVGVARARVAQADAAVAAAELNLTYMKVRAPRRGVVSRRTVEPGQMVDPARPLMAITALDDVWVVANFKEDQLAKMRPGQPAKVTIDAFPGRAFAAHVDSLAGGTGARFSLLPPDNASGNFTKVVQRVPVLVRFDGLDGAARPLLRPGLSAYVTITTKPVGR